MDGVVQPGLVPGREIGGHPGEAVVAGARVQPHGAVGQVEEPPGAAAGVGQVPPALVDAPGLQAVAGPRPAGGDPGQEPVRLRRQGGVRGSGLPQAHAVAAGAVPPGLGIGVGPAGPQEVEGALEALAGELGRRLQRGQDGPLAQHVQAGGLVGQRGQALEHLGSGRPVGRAELDLGRRRPPAGEEAAQGDDPVRARGRDGPAGQHGPRQRRGAAQAPALGPRRLGRVAPPVEVADREQVAPPVEGRLEQLDVGVLGVDELGAADAGEQDGAEGAGPVAAGQRERVLGAGPVPAGGHQGPGLAERAAPDGQEDEHAVGRVVLLGVDAALDDGQILPQLHDPGAVGLRHARADEVAGDHLGESALGVGVGGGGRLVGIAHAPMTSQLRSAAGGRPPMPLRPSR